MLSRLRSSSSVKASSSERTARALSRVSRTSSADTSNSWAISSTSGSPSRPWPSRRAVFEMSLSRLTLFMGRRTVRACSAMLWRMDCLIHHYGVGDELVALGAVEALGGGEQSHVAGADQVGQREAAVLVVFGHVDDESQVGLDEFVAGVPVALLDAGSQFDFALAAKAASDSAMSSK